MWEYQRNFQRSLEHKAKEIFMQVSSELEPIVFLVGLHREPGDNTPHICVEPLKKEFNLDILKDLDRIAEKIQIECSQKDIVKTIEQFQKVFTDNMRTDCMHKAMQQILDIHFKDADRISFVSMPVMKDNHQIFVVMQFPNSVYNTFYSLHQFEAESTKLKKSKVHTSFVNALVHTFLKEATEALYKPNPGMDYNGISTDNKEISRMAGASFVGTAIPARSRSSGTYDLFDICNYISSLKYEGNFSFGKMVICKEDHPNISNLIKLTIPVQLRDFRKVRKLLEVASEEFMLHTDGNKILGFAELRGKYEPADENLFIVNFIDAQKWELIHDTETMMIVEYTIPRLPSPRIERSRFDSMIKRKFPNIQPNAVNLLWDIVNSAAEQKHGSLVIISKNAKSEAERLKNQSIPLDPIVLKKKIIKLLTSIDGALLFDTFGVCHAIGVILDGMASTNGSSSRGARYNSAIRYIDGNQEDAVAIIISEDGLIDLYPSMKPQIRKSDIEENLLALRNHLSFPSPDYDVFRSIMNWFEENRFYLTKEVCDEINSLRDEFNSKMNAGAGMVYILDFKPHPELNDSYFMNE